MNKIEKANQAFKSATKAQKRVMIAKDALAQITQGRIKVSSGIYFDANINIEGLPSYFQLREIFHREEFSCKCCALGALMVSCTRYNNKVLVMDRKDFTDLGGRILLGKKLRNEFDSIFSYSQMALIEFAFEDSDNSPISCYGENISKKVKEKVFNFVKNLRPRAKLIKILKNIIKNNGTFKP